MTRHPSLQGGVSGYITAEGGNYDLADTEAAINLPVSSSVALRLADRVIYHNGYYTDGYNDDKTKSTRLEMLFEPSTDLSLLLSSDYSHANEQGPGATLRPYADKTNPWLGGSTPLVQQEYRAFAKPLPLQPLENDGFQRIDNFGVSAELTWQTSLGTVTILPAFRNLYDASRNYTAGFFIDLKEGATQESFEARIASDDTQRLSYVAGTYLADENRTSDQLALQILTGSRTLVSKAPDDTRAVFGQVKLRVTDDFRLTAGARYTHEVKSFTGGALSLTNIFTPYSGNESYNNISYRGGGEYDLSANSLLYASVGDGFKAGGFFSGVNGANTYKPEVLDAYSIGSKNSFLDGRLRINGEAFLWKYRDHQEFHLGLNSAGNIAGLTTNVGNATIEGAETEIDWAPWQLARVAVNAQYLDAVFNKFAYVLAAPALPPNTGCGITRISKGVYNLDCDGKSAIRAPKFSGNLELSQGFEVNGGDILRPSVSFELASSQFEGIDYTNAERQNGYVLVDLGLSYQPQEAKWGITAWARNVGNTGVMNNALDQVFAPKITVAYLRAPQTYGAKIRYDF